MLGIKETCISPQPLHDALAEAWAWAAVHVDNQGPVLRMQQLGRASYEDTPCSSGGIHTYLTQDRPKAAMIPIYVDF
jgi:hypothetical protein